MGWFTGIACLFWGVLLTATANYANGKNNVPRLKLSYKDTHASPITTITLLQEAEVIKENVNELNKRKVKCEEYRVQEEQVLNNRDNQIKLNASLKALEGERNQICTQLSEVDKTTEDLTERIRSLESEQTSLPSEITEFENEKEKLQQKPKVMTELYQEKEMKLHRKLTIEENYRLEKEKKHCKVKEKVKHVSELGTCRQRAKDLEEELERTIHFYQGQVIALEKEAHDNLLVAWTLERELNGLRKENAHIRQKLTEAELKLERLEKDPYAFDVPNTAFGRDEPVASKMQKSRNDTNDEPGNSKVPDSPGPGCVPPPGPPVPPVDPRNQLMGRACPSPRPSPRDIYGGAPGCYPPPNGFPGSPHLPLPGRNVYPPRGFPPYLPPRAGFFPPARHPESRDVLPPEVIPL